MSRKGQADKLVPAIVAPLLIIIAIAVFTSFANNTAYVFESTVVNESLGTAVKGATTALTTQHDAVKNTTVAELDIFNATWRCRNCTYHYDSFDQLTVTYGQNVEGEAFVTYVALGANTTIYEDGYSGFDRVRTGTQSSYKLASLIPYIIIAMIVVGLLFGIAILR